MGGGSWTTENFVNYSKSLSRGLSADGSVNIKNCSAQAVYTARWLDPALDPKNKIRECCDSPEHPNTIPVILALDVTGSMGRSAVEVASELNNIMTELYKDMTDVEFMIMGIGDCAYDDAPLQVSQFESDIRIAEQLDKLYFEGGGGGNSFESYTAAWQFANDNTKLDCWKRGKKGIIITMGDENLNPYLATGYDEAVGREGKDTPVLYKEVTQKYDIYHINVKHGDYNRVDKRTWTDVIGEDNYFESEVKGIAQLIPNIIRAHEGTVSVAVPVDCATDVSFDENGAIVW